MMTEDTSLVVVRCSRKTHETVICESSGEHLLKIDYQNSDPIWNRVKIPKLKTVLFTQVLIGTLTLWLQRLSIKEEI